MPLTLTSSAFEDKGTIPARYTCDGNNSVPPLSIGGVPEGVQSLVLVMDDPDIPQAIKEQNDIETFDHWVLYNIPPETIEIADGQTLGQEGVNSAGSVGYTGPCPPAQYEPTEHRYVFRLYALKGELDFTKAPTLQEVETAAQEMAIEQTELVGRYRRVGV